METANGRECMKMSKLVLYNFKNYIFRLPKSEDTQFKFFHIPENLLFWQWHFS